MVSAGYLGAQEVILLSPPLAGQTAKLYYFAGAKTDSLISMVDISGRVSFVMPTKAYRGMATLVVPGAGGIELVVAEPSVQVKCNSNELNGETAEFLHSKENQLLSHIFTSQSRYMQQQAWLKAGAQFFDADSSFLKQLQPELHKVEAAMVKLEKEITDSPLYAARFFRIANFMNRLFDTEQERDSQGAILIRKEMEESLDIASLYWSGQLWGSVLNFYISLFNHTAGEDKQQQYATSVQRTMQRLPAPYYEAYLAGCISETERFGWQQAQDSILSGLHPEFTSSIGSLQRAMGAYRTRTRQTMPEIVGLAKTNERYDKMLLAFYDSDCSTCVNEMFRLLARYPELKAQGIRVVSIAADTDKKRYEDGIKDFPWTDKLCDFESFTGTNFSHYNVAGTPSFYLLDKDRKFQGVFFKVSEIEEIILKIQNDNEV
jgi:hypothetical protein